ncbi:MAG TPA: pyridoxamine 5'-phosphate oxidase [Polyangiaceae bacterium]|nr:pyridoxamine 5'-phosphate oxidase [Polyangiaceae bacterium]
MAAEFLLEHGASPNPFEQFDLWFADAAGLPEPNAMALATVTDGLPSVRMVLLKERDARGFVFFTNYGSRKGRELTANPHAALLFFWPTLQRQIRIEGTVERVAREESAAYFRTRARGARVGAWASLQSEIVSRRELDARVSEIEAEYEGREVPVPPFWGGFRVKPASFEFWQGRTHRLHDRLRYVPDGAAWRIERLAP